MTLRTGNISTFLSTGEGKTNLVQGVLCQPEELALGVGLPPVSYTFHFHADAIAAVQGRKFLLHMSPELGHEVIRTLIRHKSDTAGSPLKLLPIH